VSENEEIAQLINRIERLEYKELLHSKSLVAIIKRITLISLMAFIFNFFVFLEIGHIAHWIWIW
jgi:hypothetical protein